MGIYYLLSLLGIISAEVKAYFKDFVIQQFLNVIDRLPSSVLETCDGKITVEECAAAISSMENNKTPGSDGLPKEFYSKIFLSVCTGICGDAESVL